MKLICVERKDHTFVTIESDSEDGIFTPEELKKIRFVIATIDNDTEEPIEIKTENIRLNKGIVLSGRAPIWVYAALVHYFHPAAWVAIYDPRVRGAVVAMTHVKNVSPGDLIPVYDSRAFICRFSRKNEIFML